MQGLVEFFKNLPKKKCQKCGHEIVEMADCYRNVCHDCDHPYR